MKDTLSKSSVQILRRILLTILHNVVALVESQEHLLKVDIIHGRFKMLPERVVTVSCVRAQSRKLSLMWLLSYSATFFSCPAASPVLLMRAACQAEEQPACLSQ